MIRFLLYIICAAVVFNTSCVFRSNVKITEYHGSTKPLIERLPIKVYAYYSDQFCSREVTDQVIVADGLIQEIKTQIGKANVELFEYILTHRFNSVKSISEFPINAEALGRVDLIIKPKLLDCRYGYFEEKPTWVVLIYLIQFYLPDGTIIDNWEIAGHADMEYTWFPPGISAWAMEPIQLAMRDVATQFFLEFCNRPKLRTFFSKECRK